ncbi:MAG: Gfo/Idh/MocA family oxidoreductase [Brevinematales bacterium]
MLKVGVVGTGHMGTYHINTLSTISGISFEAICDVNETKLKELSNKYNINYYTDYKKFLSKVDAVVVAVPTFLHYKFASEALNAGKHVLLEKPMTKTIYFAEKLFEIARKKNLVLQVGHVERFNGAVQEVQKIVNTPYLIQAQRMSPPGRIRDVGVVLDLMIHDIDIVLLLANSEVVDVYASGSKVFSDFEDVATAVIYFESGAVASISASRVTENKIRNLAISQKGSYVFLNYDTQEITITRQPSSDYTVLKEEIKYKQEFLVEKVYVHKENALRLEQLHFIDCIINGKKPDFEPEDDLAAHRIAKKITEKIYRSWKR